MNKSPDEPAEPLHVYSFDYDLPEDAARNELYGANRGTDDKIIFGQRGCIMRISAVGTISLYTNCHGESSEIKEEVEQALAEACPDDRATGFSEDDLRGWMWAEVKSNGCLRRLNPLANDSDTQFDRSHGECIRN